MASAGKILYLPVQSPEQFPVRQHGLPRRQTGAQQLWQHHIYRLPPRERPDTFVYTAKGYALTTQTNGTIIDLYV